MTILNGMSINYRGTDYEIRVVKARRVSLRFDDHGFIPIVETDCVTLPGLIMGERSQYLGPWLIDFLETIGASSWEGVQNRAFVVLFKDGIARGVAGLDNDKVMLWKEWGEGLTT